MHSNDFRQLDSEKGTCFMQTAQVNVSGMKIDRRVLAATWRQSVSNVKATYPRCMEATTERSQWLQLVFL